MEINNDHSVTDMSHSRIIFFSLIIQENVSRISFHKKKNKKYINVQSFLDKTKIKFHLVVNHNKKKHESGFEEIL